MPVKQGKWTFTGGIRTFFLQEILGECFKSNKTEGQSQGDNYGSCFCPNEDFIQGNDIGLLECDMLWEVLKDRSVDLEIE